MEEVEECIICSNRNFKLIANKGQYFSRERVSFCTDCGLIFLSPRMTEEESNEFYASNQFSRKFRGNDYPTPAMCAYRDEYAKRRLEILLPYLEELPKAPFLEIGCSSGNFLKLVRELGFETFGIDPSTGFVEYAKRECGLKVSVGMYPDALPQEFKGPFVATSIFHVLEHVHDPQVVLRSIYSGLTEGGYLFIEVPDIERVATLRRYIRSSYFQKAHLWDFGRSNFCRLLSSFGFQIKDIFYDSVRPYNKNMLVVAIKPVSASSDCPITEDAGYLRPLIGPNKMFRLLKFKLFLGSIVDVLAKIFRRE